jgi:hypothetical protein
LRRFTAETASTRPSASLDRGSFAGRAERTEAARAPRARPASQVRPLASPPAGARRACTKNLLTSGHASVEKTRCNRARALTVSVPADARVVGMSFATRDEMLVARPLPAVEARRQFDDATGVIRDPALLEALRPGRDRARFRLSLYPVSPDDPATVTLTIAVPRVQRVLVDVAGDRLDGRPDPAAAISPDDLAAVTARAADDRWSLYAGPSEDGEQPRSAADIRNHVRASRDQLRSCHVLFGSTTGAVTLHFTVTAEGRVTDTAVSGDVTPDVRTCLSHVMASWQFQPAAEPVQVNDPIQFVRTRQPAPPGSNLAFDGKSHLPRIGNP